jgi:hypothetical protein
VQSQIETYRAKAKEFTRLIVVAKSLRHPRPRRGPSTNFAQLGLIDSGGAFSLILSGDSGTTPHISNLPCCGGIGLAPSAAK